MTTIRFLDWLDTHHLDLADIGQGHVEHYLTLHPGRATAIQLFLTWTHRAQLTTALTVPRKSKSQPEVTLSDAQRWMQVEQLLHDPTIRLYARVTGLFILLFAQPLSRTLRMRPDQITRRDDGTITANFDTMPIELPEILDELVLQQLHVSRSDRFAGHHQKWLFPGRNAGRHLVTENVRAELTAHGIQPHQARKAAMFHLAAEIPTPVLAELIGVSPTTATKWAALAARDWSAYTAMRLTTAQTDT